MGKLHTLKRAIRRAPDRFLYPLRDDGGYGRYGSLYTNVGARFDAQTRQWVPDTSIGKRASYAGMILHLLTTACGYVYTGEWRERHQMPVLTKRGDSHEP
jgi:hypothetical protein